MRQVVQYICLPVLLYGEKTFTLAYNVPESLTDRHRTERKVRTPVTRIQQTAENKTYLVWISARNVLAQQTRKFTQHSYVIFYSSTSQRGSLNAVCCLKISVYIYAILSILVLWFLSVKMVRENNVMVRIFCYRQLSIDIGKWLFSILSFSNVLFFYNMKQGYIITRLCCNCDKLIL